MKCSDIFDTSLENIPTGESKFLRGELKFEIFLVLKWASLAFLLYILSLTLYIVFTVCDASLLMDEKTRARLFS